VFKFSLTKFYEVALLYDMKVNSFACGDGCNYFFQVQLGSRLNSRRCLRRGLVTAQVALHGKIFLVTHRETRHVTVDK